MVNQEFELLKYQFELLRKMVNVDENPFYDYLIDYNITREQHKWVVDLMIVLSFRLKKDNEILDENSQKYYLASKDSFVAKYGYLNLDTNQLFSDQAPTFKEFESVVSTFLPEDVKPLTLLKRMKQQEIYADFCEYLIRDSEKQDA